jgi:CheY-like chemotaxis protein
VSNGVDGLIDSADRGARRERATWRCLSCGRPFDLGQADWCEHTVGGPPTHRCPACGTCICEADLRSRRLYLEGLPDTLYQEMVRRRARARTRTRELAGSHTKLPVLVIDDQPSVARLIARTIRAMGVPTVTLHEGREALRLLKQQPVSAIVTDVLLPGMDGWQLCRTIKAQRALRHIPVIFLSGVYRRPSDHRTFEGDSGPAAFLTKPVSAEHLQRTLRALVPELA